MTTEEFHRKLTAILSADVQGYSRLMGEDEDSTVRTLTAYRALMTSLIQSHRGQVVDTPGDNLLAEFGSVMDAVRCAVEIQEELRIRNADLPENRKMQFRIGINMGDIIEDGDHIYGDGVNIAARVEGLAEGGGICISGTVYDAIRNKLSMSYEFMGEHVVKNIKELVRIYKIKVEPEAETAKVKEKKARLKTWQWAALSVVAIIILGAATILYFSFRQAPGVSDVKEAPKTIAVLPFVNRSSERDQEYFVDGLSDEIITMLSQIPDLQVTSSTSSFTFKNSDKTIQEIAEILGREYILEGNVRKVGNALRITAQLIHAPDDIHLWSDTYDRELKDIFEIQEDIAIAVANELKITLGISESLKPLGGTDNEEAYEYYLVAQGQSADDKLILARESLDEATVLDPKFALAWAIKAIVHIRLSNAMPARQSAAEQEAGLNAAKMAIELEPNLAEAYIAFGLYRAARGDFIEAELAIRKAFDLKTELMWTSGSAFSLFYLAVGNIEGAHEIIEATRQNDPLSIHNRTSIILYFSMLGDIKRAEEEYEHAKALFGDNWAASFFITLARLGTKESVIIDNIPEIPILDPIWAIAKEHLETPEDGLAELYRLYTDDKNLSPFALQAIWMWAAYFGDPELVLSI